MSDMQSLRQALKAELQHAKQGLSHYAARVEQIEAVLAQLDGAKGGASAKRSNGPGAKAEKAGARERGAGRQKGSASAEDAGGLPKTGLEFWLQLVTKQKQSGADIANGAAAALQLDPQKDKKQIQKLKQRSTPSLNALVASGRIKDSGTGRERRFFRG